MRGSGKRRRFLAWAILGLGVALVSAGAAEIAVSQTAERVADLVRPEMTGEGLAQHRTDFETARSTIEGFHEDVLPSVAASFGLPESLLLAELRADYPAVARIVDEQDEMVPFAESSLANLERQQRRFARADSLPASWLPGFAGGAWLILMGIVLAGSGATMARAPGRWWGPATAAVAVVAVLLAAVPLALEVPGKAAAAQTVLDSLNPSEAAVRRTEDYMAATRAGMTELDQALLPDVATALSLTRDELDEMLAEQYPEVAAGLEAMPAVLDRYETRTAIRSGGGDDLRTLKEIPIRELGWFGPAFAIVAGAAAAWAWRERRFAAEPAARNRDAADEPASAEAGG